MSPTSTTVTCACCRASAPSYRELLMRHDPHCDHGHVSLREEVSRLRLLVEQAGSESALVRARGGMF